VQLQNFLRLFLDIAAEGQRIFSRFSADAVSPELK